MCGASSPSPSTRRSTSTRRAARGRGRRDALDVDRVHIRFARSRDGRGWWPNGGARTSSPRCCPVSPMDELHPLDNVLGVTDDRSAVVVDDAGDRFGSASDQREAFEELGIRAAMKYPIVVGAPRRGVLVASEQFGPRHWSDSEVSLMEGFARRSAVPSTMRSRSSCRTRWPSGLACSTGPRTTSSPRFRASCGGRSRASRLHRAAHRPRPATTDEQRHMLSVVERNGEHLLVLIADLLTMSRMEAGTFEPKIGPVDLDVPRRRVRRGSPRRVSSRARSIST